MADSPRVRVRRALLAGLVAEYGEPEEEWTSMRSLDRIVAGVLAALEDPSPAASVHVYGWQAAAVAEQEGRLNVGDRRLNAHQTVDAWNGRYWERILPAEPDPMSTEPSLEHHRRWCDYCIAGQPHPPAALGDLAGPDLAAPKPTPEPDPISTHPSLPPHPRED